MGCAARVLKWVTSTPMLKYVANVARAKTRPGAARCLFFLLEPSTARHDRARGVRVVNTPRPAMSDQKERMVPADRSNWNAILKWSMAQQGDGTSSEPAREISEEDRRWLLDAMASGFIDEIKRMKDIIACISAGIEATHDAEEIDARVELMEELTDRVSGVDNGGELHTLGGLEPLVRYVASSPHARLRAAAAEVLGTTVQNHPKAQEAALGCDAMDPLLRMAAGEGDDAPPTDAAQAESTTTAQGDASEGTKELVKARVKALFALSCLLRGCTRAQEAFQLGDGFALLKNCLRVDHARLRTKALHLARHLATLDMRFMRACVDAGYVLAAAASLAGSLPRVFDRDADADANADLSADAFTEEDIEKGQVREAALRLMVDVARKVDFDAVPKAVDHLRSAIVVNAINAVGKAYTRFGREEKETYRDEMQLCAQLAKMFE